MSPNQTSFKNCLDHVERRLKQANITFDYCKRLTMGGQISYAYNAAFALVHKVEQLALLTRVLPAYTGNPQAAATTERILLDTIPVKIGFTQQGWFGVTIPVLLPKKSKGSPEYIRSYLYPSMRQFFQEREPISYSNCVLIFRHIYSQARPERAYRDHDNIEINAVADIVALYVMKDDSALRCAHYYCSAVGDSDRTEVYVVHQSELADWLVAERSFPDAGIELLENYP